MAAEVIVFSFLEEQRSVSKLLMIPHTPQRVVVISPCSSLETIERILLIGTTTKADRPRTTSILFPVRIPESYSYLKATIGSTFVARLAGIKQAASATNTSNALTTTIVIGSYTLTSYNIDFK